MKKSDKTKILVVDDESAIREVFFRVVSLGIPKCRVDIAIDGWEACERFYETHYAVIIMDVKMPRMDGITAFNNIVKYCKENNWEEPSIIFCTGYDAPEEVTKIVKKNPKHSLLTKPVPNEILINEIKSRLQD